MQVITRLDVASESSGVGSCDISEGSDSPPLVSGPGYQPVTDTDFISRYFIYPVLDLQGCKIGICRFGIDIDQTKTYSFAIYNSK